ARGTAMPMWRVTLTPVIINAAAEILFLVSGGAKADIVRRVLEGPHVSDKLPAQLIKPANGRVHWVLDAAAAARLGKEAP
ncbi:MAG TPA: 6-phosphogluconolactonase, partial [Steroidobacteraceae bacterium]|nr:6-phosphogluconolactonase [Steroidobacteraceae bacterium]